jgi:enoyl-CoA hydratase/3-hydroxyacyl-CoA dehydrogenase
MLAVEVVESGVVDIQDADSMIRSDLGWKEGPFTMMNRIGLQDSMQMVVEKMALSHQKEINFPIPQMLIDQVRRGEPWPLNSKIK